MQQKIVPCLWFNNDAEEAVTLYTSLFAGSSTGLTARYGKPSANVSGQPEGSVMTQKFFLEGQEFLALNGGPVFKFTQALSLYVFSADEAELERLWRALTCRLRRAMKNS